MPASTCAGVRGTGPAGRIGHDDLEAFLRGAPKAATATGRRAETSVETVKIIGLRRRIAQKMAETTRRVAHFSYVEEIDVTALEELRATLNAEERPDHPRLTLMPFLMQALVQGGCRVSRDECALRRRGRDARAAWRRPYRYRCPDAGRPHGAGGPPLRSARVVDCAAEVQRLAEAARAGRATSAELSGSTITITSRGALGGIVTTPVINRPEVAIVGVNRQVVRPVWQGAQFVPRTMMNLSSSFDHRVIDGYVAARFVQRIKSLLEAPATIFIEA